MEKNLEECSSLNRDEMRRHLIAIKDEEFYKIMAINCPWVTDDQSILQKPTFFFGDTIPNDLIYQRRCFQFSYSVCGQEKIVATRLTFDRTVSIMSLSPTCTKREDPPIWVKITNVIKSGIFVGGPLGYVEKSSARLDILMPTGAYQSFNYPSVDLRPVVLTPKMGLCFFIHFQHKKKLQESCIQPQRAMLLQLSNLVGTNQRLQDLSKQS